MYPSTTPNPNPTPLHPHLNLGRFGVHKMLELGNGGLLRLHELRILCPATLVQLALQVCNNVLLLLNRVVLDAQVVLMVLDVVLQKGGGKSPQQHY